jgi:DNA-directed RNA polymerase specialized sigma24 family protein
MAAGDTWTPDAEEQLIKLALEGKTPQEIARLVGRSQRAVIIRLTQVAEDRSQWSRAIKLLKESSDGCQ